jgi:hypothetical protein
MLCPFPEATNAGGKRFFPLYFCNTEDRAKSGNFFWAFCILFCSMMRIDLPAFLCYSGNVNKNEAVNGTG